MLKLGIPKGAVEQKKTLDRIRPEDLQKVKLKKGKVIDKKNNGDDKVVDETVDITCEDKT